MLYMMFHLNVGYDNDDVQATWRNWRWLWDVEACYVSQV